MCITEPLSYTLETNNTVNQLYFNKKIFFKSGGKGTHTHQLEVFVKHYYPYLHFQCVIDRNVEEQVLKEAWSFKDSV